MKNNNKYHLIILTLSFFILFLFSKTLATETKHFLSLKNNEVNVRVGPSKKHPIKFTYNKKYLPIEVLEKSATWRKIKDLENNSGWIHISQLSKRKTAINIKNNSLLYQKSTIYSKKIAKLEVGRLVIIKKCKEKWCKIISGNYRGWIFKKSLWGKTN